ncbi:MAG: nickel pincer cofactor biosynthesis protein LarB [Candidatus Altiarchaeota archaeon]
MKEISNPDIDRINRCAIPEVIYGGGKENPDLADICKRFLSEQGRAIITKVDGEKAKYVKKSVNKIKGLDFTYNERGKVLVAKKKGFKRKIVGAIGLVTAGTSDIPIGEEARVVAEELGCEVIYDYDVGVAGIHRVFPVLKKMNEKGVSAIIAVAGMEGALPSVISGLVDVPVIGVPTSVGYGTSNHGLTALNAMLNACSPVGVVNIDNGYGAAVLAFQICRKK